MAGDHHGVVEFTGHSFVLTDRDPDEVVARGADGFGGASHPDLLRWLAGTDGWIGNHDAVLATRGTGAGSVARRLPERSDLDDHPRVVRSRAHRSDVHVYGDDTGLVTIGRGLVGRTEVSVEAFGGQPAGTGRTLIAQARALVAAGESSVRAGGARQRSVAAGLSGCGFVPIGAETLLRSDRWK